ncbi:M4 family metallopeptidase [Subsaxibacter sp. CAU 1640]|uniref:M4 family metallopeptidase n=1 Tax=Subsaxibacter sp. CAU 1640 TaxID=2933271 RepID=UPI002002D5CF|nr:M4 family metallopeptidase [Subsaxibacter sp. CAU 1640]MCK7591763.1 M4 family metallopeptidase [Subsaxibacter sp. CAU 1640]
MKISTWILSFVLTISSFAQAQNSQSKITELKREHHAIVTQNSVTGLAEFVRFPIGNAMTLNGATLKQKALYFLQNFKEIYNIDSVEETLVFDKIQIDNYGLENVIFKQVYQGVPVFDGQLRFHFNSNKKLTAINGNYIPGISKLKHEPYLSHMQAQTIALETISNQGLNISGQPLLLGTPLLYVFPKGLLQGHVESIYLTYEIEVYNKLDVREFIYINAHSGELVEQFTGMAHALDRKIYENNTNNLIWQEGSPFPGTLTIWQRNEVEASGHVYNFFKNAFGYVSYNGADITMRTINNNPNIFCPNANWNGYTANYCDGTASDDVIAHEWGHAYTQYTSGLIYAYQSGAINESYSDIWGETIDLLNNYEDVGENLNIRTTTACNSARWKIGEDASAFGSPIRDMWYPPCKGDPGKVTDGQYSCGDFDSGGVHINSGIPNHAYALLVDGGFYNGQTINGIGFVKAAHIFWRAQNVYLTPTSDFAALADALEAACTDLIGINLQGLSTTGTAAGLSGQIINASDLQSLVNALLAVELRINPDACGYAPILAATPPLCEAANTNPIFFENWESGTDVWTVTQLPSNANTWQPRDWTVTSSLPQNRTGNAMFGPDPINGNCTSDLENGIIRLESPLISIPNVTTGNFELAFNHYVATENQWDGGNLKIRVNNGQWTLVPSNVFIQNPYNSYINTAAQGNDNPMQGELAFTGTDGGSLTSTWGQSVVNLSLLGVGPNSTVQFRFELGTDGCNGNDGWYIDEIIVYNCTSTLSVTDYDNLSNAIKVFPNPSNGKIVLKKVQNINLSTAKIFDINGRLISTLDLTSLSDELEVDITKYNSGMYFMRINTVNGQITIKLIKN